MIQTVSVLHEIVVQTGGGDINTWAQNQIRVTTHTIKLAGAFLATLVALVGGWRAKGALAGVISALLVAALYAWGVLHIGDSSVQNKISQTVDTNGMAPPPGIHLQAPTHPGGDGLV